MTELYPFITEAARAMMFVDGENLAMRYGAMLKEAGKPLVATPWYRPDVMVWAQALSPDANSLPGTRILRKHCYTSAAGDDVALAEIADWLKERRFEAPRVFKKEGTSKRSKQVDISLCTDMLLHGFRRHYDIAVLVAGDGDYVPLVRAVKSEGARVHVWFVMNGLSPKLRREADYFVDIGPILGI